MEPLVQPRVFSDRYELTHLIARGGMAQVYRARDRLLDRPVALKVLFPELSVDRAFVERFRREAQAAANLSHPNIVPVFDWGEDSGTYFIVMEFVDGRPLSAVLRAEGPLPGARAADIGAHVAAALSYAHRHGVIHRDVKPGNVLITDEGQVKVTDFGIARAVNTEESLTQTGAVMGTAAYFSPEQAEGVGVDARSDLYSLGVVLFEMVTGRTPFIGESPVAVASKHVRDQPPLPRELNPAVPVPLEAVIMKAMAKSPEGRYADAEELRADLLRFAEGRPVLAADALTQVQAGLGATGVMGATGVLAPAAALSPTGETQVVAAATDPAVAAEEEARRRRTRRLVLLLLLLLVVLAVVAYFLLKSLGVIGGNGNITVPNVVGQTQPAATATLQQDGLTVGTTTRAPSNRPVGVVTATNPGSGQTVKKGDKVNLTVSSGVVQVTVPNVVGLLLTDAEALLQSRNLTFKPQFVTSTATANTVLHQSPAPGHRVPTGTQVLLTLPQPQSTVNVPNLNGQTPTQAGVLIGAAGLQVGTQSRACSNGTQSGLVSASNPSGGTAVPHNSTVNLVISSGSCQVVVQNVQGLTQNSATSALQNQGLSVAASATNSCSSNQNGTVVQQSPSGGTSVGNGATVNITICNYSPPPTTTVPPPTTTTTAPPTTTTTAPTTTTTVPGN